MVLYKKVSKLDSCLMTIMMDKKKYDYYYKHPDKVLQVKLFYAYYPLNYPFPNVNPIFYNQNNKSIWIIKIKRMYYYTGNKIDKYWYKIIKIH